MALEIKKHTPVLTSDGREVGQAVHLHHRKEEAAPALQIYATYLGVWDEELGVRYFIPTEFIDSYDDDEVWLTVKWSTVMNRAWNRAPQFIAIRNEVREELPDPMHSVAA